jgi:hypothetical protein
MASIQGFDDNITMYNNLKSDLNTILSYLNYAKDSTGKAQASLDEVYMVNNYNTKVYSRTASLNTNVTNTSNYLKNYVLPAIDDALNNTKKAKSEYEAEQQRLAAEQRAREEAERRAAEQRAHSYTPPAPSPTPAPVSTPSTSSTPVSKPSSKKDSKPKGRKAKEMEV